jgi:hypothetical protein
MVMENSTKRILKKWHALVVIFFLAAFATNVQAQNVTVRPSNGSMLASVKTGGTTDAFYSLGGFATWKHEQLNLTITTADSDRGELTDNGQIANPANNIFSNANADELQLGRGQSLDNYIAFCLPKGYRFTGYTITFSRNINLGNGGGGQASFGETDSSFGNYTKGDSTYRSGLSYSANAEKQTISRTSKGETDMENVLYFKLTNSNGRAFISLHHVELLFSAEADYTPLVAGVPVTNVSAVDIPFSTSKVDYGSIENRYYNGVWRVSYQSSNIQDITANMTLYEAESVEDGTNAYDGTEGKMVKYGEGSISSSGEYFKLGSGDAEKEQIYYIETPIWVKSASSDHKNPIGYRIVGASFDYSSTSTSYVPATFYIQYQGMSTYYLNTSGQFNTSNQTVWSIDEEGYISSGGYYMYVSGTALAFQSVSQGKPTADVGTFVISNNQICRKSNPTQHIYKNGSGNAAAGVGTSNSRVASYVEITAASTTPGETIGQYTLNIYDKTGTSVAKTVTVNGTSGTLSIDGLNNDAVKIGVKGTGLIKGNITMQALDPYIDRLNIVCHEEGDNGRTLSQTFTATDFSVRGGKFIFYVPEDFSGDCYFTFEDLYSKYGDNTYWDGTGTGNARYSLVMSPYWSGMTNVYQTDPNHTYVDKVWTQVVGDIPYEFNNAEEVGTSGGDYEEYVFNPGLYGDGLEGSTNHFINFEYSAEEIEDETEKTAYLFTCDETRYNIAPTTAVQHTYYAYYQMDITIIKYTYLPQFTWVPVYTKTLYKDGDTVKEDAQYGLKLSTTEADEEGNYGYLNASQVVLGINEALGTSGAPATKSQILYIDGSELLAIVESNTYKYSNIMDGLGANALFYLPDNTSTNLDNCAYVTQKEPLKFRGANNIVLTDMMPFYAPYDIYVDAAKNASYERKITKSTYGEVKNASLIMPFELTVTSGVHTNVDGSKITLRSMQNNAALTQQDGKTYAYFPALSDVSETVANTPYMVSVGNNTAENGSFVVSQTGALIKATTGMDKTKYTFDGETATGVNAAAGDAQGTYTFTNKGTYAGLKIAKADNVFYFAKDMFVSSKNLDDAYSYANIAPFRAFYATGNLSSGAKLMNFGVILGEGEGDVPTAIHAVDAAQIIDVNAPVYDLQGRMVAPAYRDVAGKKLAAGMYVVNGVKFIVK